MVGESSLGSDAQTGEIFLQAFSCHVTIVSQVHSDATYTSLIYGKGMVNIGDNKYKTKQYPQSQGADPSFTQLFWCCCATPFTGVHLLQMLTFFYFFPNLFSFAFFFFRQAIQRSFSVPSADPVRLLSRLSSHAQYSSASSHLVSRLQ